MATSPLERRFQSPNRAMSEVIDVETDVEITPLPPPAHLGTPQVASPAIVPLAERRGSRIIQGWTKRHVHRWRSPLLMVLFFLLGLSVSIAHCVFYPKLRGKVVGDSNQQEEKIRFGTAFAFLAQICLGASVWTAYTQWMWRTVKRKSMTVAAWNCAFSADTSFLSLLNIEMLRKLRLGSAMAFFAWSLLLPSFFTPATLFIYGDTDVVELTAMVPYPAIGNMSEAHRFTYSPPMRRGTTQNLDDETRVFTGPRTALNLVTTAASAGQILTADLPYNNSAYSVSFFAPIVKCTDANETEAHRIDDFLLEEMKNGVQDRKETDSAYYSFVPTWNSTGQLTAVWHPRQQTPSRPINELWMTFLRPTFDTNGDRIKARHYQICRPRNASYDLSISQYHGVQTVSGNYTISEAITFPNDGPNDISNMTQHAYTAFMWAFSDQLVGKFAWFNQTTTNTTGPQTAAQFGVIDSPIQRTSLLGSLDLDALFEMDEEKGLYKDQHIDNIFNLSDQRLRDKALARNRTLDVLIEELSFNTTISLMQNRLLTNSRETLIQLTNDVNRYSYKAYALFIPYALANVFSFVCVCIGIISFLRDGVLPGRKVQDIIYAARDSAMHRHRFSLGSRKMSMTAIDDGKGDVMIRVVEVHGADEGVNDRGFMWKKTSWRRKDRDDEKVDGCDLV